MFKKIAAFIHLFNKFYLSYAQALYSCSNQLSLLPVKYIFLGRWVEEYFPFLDQLFYILLS